MPANPETLWAEKYAARFAEERAREDARREQAFLDLPLVVAGEPLRAMTPVDLLVLNGVGSPFVGASATPPTPGEIAVFFWWLSVDNDHSDTWRNRRAQRRLVRRIAGLPYADTVAAIRDYCDEVFQDQPQGGESGEKRPFGACFLAPLVVSIALETGWSQHEILRTPLSRLFQYTKAIRARHLGKEFKDFSPSDRLTGDFLSELNEQLNARAGAN